MRVGVPRTACVLAVALCSLGPPAAADTPAPEATSAERQYTFSWRYAEGSRMAPRGGSTAGAEVSLAPAPDPAWQRLQAPGLTAFERDRRAILAMAGEFRVSFDFIEIAGFRAPWSPDRPYQSWATEKVYVIEDGGDTISLQHILVMRVQGPDGTALGPFVTRHWRQDWHYEARSRLVYRGRNRWQAIAVPDAAVRGHWVQSVWQVDDSPRYSGVGRWQHYANYSSWVSGEEWRPLPRREFSVRDDYSVLVGSNRHTVTPDGWIQEEQNLKVALDEHGEPRAGDAVVARELGLNRYERIAGFDFAAGDRYLERTAPLWAEVRAAWQAEAAAGELELRGASDRDQLFVPLFDYADQLAGGKTPAAEEIARYARQAVRDYLVPAGAHETPASK
jgi:hypothetical protein